MPEGFLDRISETISAYCGVRMPVLQRHSTLSHRSPREYLGHRKAEKVVDKSGVTGKINYIIVEL